MSINQINGKNPPPSPPSPHPPLIAMVTVLMWWLSTFIAMPLNQSRRPVPPRPTAPHRPETSVGSDWPAGAGLEVTESGGGEGRGAGGGRTPNISRRVDSFASAERAAFRHDGIGGLRAVRASWAPSCPHGARSRPQSTGPPRVQIPIVDPDQSRDKSSGKATPMCPAKQFQQSSCWKRVIISNKKV